MLTRRALLTAAGASAPAFAFGDASRFVPALVKHGHPTWDSRASGLKRLAFELQRRTSLECALEARPMALDGTLLFEHPFLYLSTEGELPTLTASQVEGLRRYLTFGGIVWAEAADGDVAGAAATSLKRELARVLPQAPLAELPRTHVLHKSFYLLENPVGRVVAQSSFWAAQLNRRCAVVFSANDTMGALTRDDSAGWAYDCQPGGERQREYALRTAINVALYATCLDYKDDAVHIEEIMGRRR
jgi:hypothetical protein